MRADQLLVERGLAATRSQAQRLIAAGVSWRLVGEWRRVTKNGEDLPVPAELRLDDAAESRYVSRGGLKLEGALTALDLSVQGALCLDVGQSTGGFTDCLLHQGAQHVVGVDVGQGQLHPRLVADPRVTSLEHCNARHLVASDLIARCDHLTRGRCGFGLENLPFEGQFDRVVGDVSFISLTLVLPALAPLLRPQGQLLMLVKPQFELQAHQLGKGGVVRDEHLYDQVEDRLRRCCADLGLTVAHWLDSPIAGGDGNREFFVHALP